ncbi:2-dehydro-3-deoxygluconokinase [Amphibacillus marinus]|uniref:2-dehydro-3-deoxygluconokinase n=1 Tax=Amphibacillus marinus TaxID=872970 RepID=A0A1H8LDB1_9BACI|nr:sugar kinase [Amphibacillus marinus]SEO03131.1 2-dehydro-3-deoxygluconokinase [Amphibacillus marinus]
MGKETNMDVVTFGEAMAMFIADQPGPLTNMSKCSLALAGAEVNVAIGLARLGYQTGWVSQLGNDEFGRFILDRLAQERVNLANVTINKVWPTGFQFKSKVRSGDPRVEYFRANSAASKIDQQQFSNSYFLNFSHLHLTGIPLAISKSARMFSQLAITCMREQGRPISFDPNLRPMLWKSKHEMIDTVNIFAKQANYFLPGLEEGRLLTGRETPEDIADFYLEQGVEMVAVKLANNGAYYKTRSKSGYVSQIPVTKVVDTVGAGDGFAVGVISGLLDGLTIEETIFRANIIGALAVQSEGDHDNYPTREQLEKYQRQFV